MLIALRKDKGLPGAFASAIHAAKAACVRRSRKAALKFIHGAETPTARDSPESSIGRCEFIVGSEGQFVGNYTHKPLRNIGKRDLLVIGWVGEIYLDNATTAVYVRETLPVLQIRVGIIRRP